MLKSDGTTADERDDLAGLVTRAAQRFEVDLKATLPRSAARLLDWRSASSFAVGGLAVRSFPVLWLPHWIAASAGAAPDPSFQLDVAYSTINGYCAIRLLDDVTDGDRADWIRKLLPATAYFHSAFQFAFEKYFDAKHPFWQEFRTAWADQADAACDDALPGESATNAL